MGRALWDLPGSCWALDLPPGCSLCLEHSGPFTPAHPPDLRSGTPSSRKPSGPPGWVSCPLSAPAAQPCPLWGCLRMDLSALHCEPGGEGQAHVRHHGVPSTGPGTEQGLRGVRERRRCSGPLCPARWALGHPVPDRLSARSSGTSRSFTDATPASTSASAWTSTTTTWPTWRPSTTSWRFVPGAGWALWPPVRGPSLVLLHRPSSTAAACFSTHLTAFCVSLLFPFFVTCFY